MMDTPTHAPSLHHVEVGVPSDQRKAHPPNDFDDLDVIVDRFATRETRDEQSVKPFHGKFATTDLADLDRLDPHRPTITSDPSQPRAA